MITAIVLAAGEAKRFGRCKQLISLGAKPLVQHVLDNLRESAIDDVVLVLGAHAGRILEQIRLVSERVILNPDYANGMSTSIQAGLAFLPAMTEAAMIVLADQPFVTPSTLDSLINTYRSTRAAVVIPTFDDRRGNPVIVDRSLFAEIMEIRGDVGCRSIFGKHADSVALVPTNDRGILTDIDAPEDLDLAGPSFQS